MVTSISNSSLDLNAAKGICSALSQAMDPLRDQVKQ